MRFRCLTLISFSLIGTAAPAAAQDMWSDSAVMAGQSAVLNDMNRETTRRLHREKGLPEPDFDAAPPRPAVREEFRKRLGIPGKSASKAEKCAFMRTHLTSLKPDQAATYYRHCP